MDFEAILPFQLMSLPIAALGYEHPGVAPLTWVVLMLAAQVMILARTFDRDQDKRLGYLLSNELYCALSTAAIVFAPLMLAGKLTISN